MSRRRVVVTGLGVLSPCGQGWKPYWTSVLNGKSHIDHLKNLSLNGFPSKYGGEILDFDPAKGVKNRKSLKVMSRTIMLAVSASDQAILDSGLNLDRVDRKRFGVSLGTGIINNDLDELAQGMKEGFASSGFDLRRFGQSGIKSLFPLWFLKYLPNMPACHISIAHGLKGPNNTITTSAAAGTQAIGEAFRIIERGDADLMIAGGADSKLNPMGMSRFHLLGLLSKHSENPSVSYRPFDENRDGLVLGEGGGFLVLEEYKHARARGAKIYGEVKGYGSSSDFIHDPRYQEDYTGKCLAMKRALYSAQRIPEEVDVILANGSGVPLDDIQEARAIHSVFEEATDQVMVTGVKPITGHLVYGSGGVEAAAGLLTISEQVVPHLANLEKPDPACHLHFVQKKPVHRRIRTLLFNSFGFGGQNASLVVTRYE